MNLPDHQRLLRLPDSVCHHVLVFVLVHGIVRAHGSGHQEMAVSDDHVARSVQAYLADCTDEDDENLIAHLKSAVGAAGGAKSRGGGSASAAQSSLPAPNKDEAFQATPEATRALLAFQSRVRRCPSQGVRYAWNGAPLWSTAPAPKAARSPIPKCACGADRLFELQLMPSLLFALRVDDHVLAPAEASGPSSGSQSAAVGAQNQPPEPPEPPAPELGLSAVSATTPPPAADMAPSVSEGAGEADEEGFEATAPSSQQEPGSAVVAEAGPRVVSDAEKLTLASGGMDWGVVAVYSCAESCDASFEEFVVVQSPVQ